MLEMVVKQLFNWKICPQMKLKAAQCEIKELKDQIMKLEEQNRNQMAKLLAEPQECQCPIFESFTIDVSQ